MTEVAVIAFDGISPFHLAVPALVFGAAGIDSTAARYTVTVCAERPGTLTSAAGFGIAVEHGLEVLDGARMVVVPSWRTGREPSPALLGALRSAHAQGARIVGLCLGAQVVAATGLVAGRELVTHWAAAPALARAYPEITVRKDILWSDLGDVVTSAGVAAALDCCLHIVRTDHGTAAATSLARALVLAPHRNGTQAQFIPVPLTDGSDADPLERALVWARANLECPVSLDNWAAAAQLSRRTFTRQFRARTGASPQQWLLQQRVDRARLLLETGTSTMDRVARESGFATAVSMRHHFKRLLGVSPAAHRAEFRGAK